jgi:hypothetical protein
MSMAQVGEQKVNRLPFLTVFSAETLGWRNQFWQRCAATVRTEVGLTCVLGSRFGPAVTRLAA